MRTESFSLRGGHTSQLHTRVSTGGDRWFDGPVLLAEGMVNVMIDPVRGYTRFDAVVGGRQYIGTEQRALTPRGSVTVARRWLRSLTSPDHP